LRREVAKGLTKTSGVKRKSGRDETTTREREGRVRQQEKEGGGEERLDEMRDGRPLQDESELPTWWEPGVACMEEMGRDRPG
jgi:hypothetical protein